MKRLGFTNKLALVLVVLLVFMVAGGFYLACLSIQRSYTGALYCYTVIATPLGTALSVVLAKEVYTSKAALTEGGIKYEAAKAAGFKADAVKDSPAI
ncbi:MAG: hypothetical protein LUB58_02210 [Oscillospiraceae bacterium]|nr:hypothetical protein [Oscillospiraceae bacterium]